MGIYSNYINLNMDFNTLTNERTKWLSEISKLRNGRPIIVYASDIMNPKPVSTGIDYSDLAPFLDLLSDLPKAEGLDIILQTPGGSAEIVEMLVKAIRKKYSDVCIIIPGMAMSAGTIFAMSADDIMMGSTSTLGPIDAQVSTMGKRYSADAFLAGLDAIKQEVADAGILNSVYIPILQQISPGEIQTCLNAQALSANLVRDWLEQYKFSHWITHSKTGKPVTARENINEQNV